MQSYETCTICYEETDSFHALSCCDVDKKICSNCINCLRSPLCPYCRNTLDEGLLVNNLHVKSAPETISWTSFIHDELLINPYDPEFADSRILRRQIRRIRRRFLSEQNRNNRNRNRNNTNRVSTRSRRAERRQARQQLRNSVRLNNNQFDLQFELELL